MWCHMDDICKRGQLFCFFWTMMGRDVAKIWGEIGCKPPASQRGRAGKGCPKKVENK